MNSTLEFFIGTIGFILLIYGYMLSNYFFSKEHTYEWYPIFGLIFFGFGIPFLVIRVLRMVDLEDWQFTPYLLIVSGILGAIWAYIRMKQHAKELYDNWDDPFYRNRKKW
jgi:tellurite resistance protein TehA-like permease